MASRAKGSAIKLTIKSQNEVEEKLDLITNALTALSKRVDSMECRQAQGQIVEEPSAPAKKKRRTKAPPNTDATEAESARQALVEMTRAKEAAEAEAAAGRAEIARLQAAADEAAERSRAENESLRATLIAIRGACQCPILHDFTGDMVVASDGVGYDRRAIQQWRLWGNTSPVTRERFKRRLFPNRFARKVYEELQKVGLGQVENSKTSGASNSSTSHKDHGPAASSSASRAVPAAEAEAAGLLLAAIKRKDEATVLRLLRQPQPPGLNDVDIHGSTVLHWAIGRELHQVALDIASKKEFSGINATNRWGCTALHYAARRGLLQICQAIIGREEFTELLAVDSTGSTARQQARENGHKAVVDLLW